jgi:hypothetical protein
MNINKVTPEKIYKISLALILTMNIAALFFLGSFIHKHVYGAMNIDQNHIRALAHDDEKTINESAYKNVLEILNKKNALSLPQPMRSPFEDLSPDN